MSSRHHRLVFTLAAAVLITSLLSGCQVVRYAQARGDDFLDIWDLGIGITAESQHSWIPPTLGAHAEFGPIALGAITHNGLTAEIDGRGLFAGRETRSRLSAIWLQGIRHWQDYENGWCGFYKDINRSRAWHERMRENSYTKKIFHEGTIVIAKDLLHDNQDWHWEVFPLRRGWQYWETISVELGICEPFLTHLGVYARAGVDPSEILDFVLGFLTIDLKRDDLYQRPPRVEPGPLVIREEVPVVQEVPVEVVRTLHTRTFEFGDVLFNLDDDTLTSRGDAQVTEIEDALANADIESMRVTGHCCDRGTDEYNYELGLRRANTVADSLADRGFDRGAMEVESLGELQPRVPNINESSRSLNRRVEVRVTFTVEE
jgi:outer membrane protein OmpA-like peptidoglycan-associated protein